MKTNNRKLIIFILLLLPISFQACKKENVDVSQETQVKNTIVKVMKEWYLWNDKLPATIDVNNYATPQDLVDALKYSTFDKWSYIQDSESYYQYYQAGQYAGHGFGSKLDNKNQLWITFVYKNSPAEKAGFTRGCQVLKINGKNVSEITDFSNVYGASSVGVNNSFQIKDLSGSLKDITLTKEEITINSVLYRDVKIVNGQKIGYLVFNSFIETSTAEIDEAFTYFQAQGITELILDLRYNGGGRINISQYLASIIAGGNNTNKAYITYAHNAQKQAENKTLSFVSTKFAFNFNKIICITSKASASASELVINGLKPYMNVLLVGESTYGKPVGSYGFEFGGYVLNPISLRLSNALGTADYYTGIPVNASQNDGLSKNWGDETESCLSEALYYYKNGGFSGLLLLKTEGSNNEKNQKMFDHPFKEEIGAF